MDPIIIIAVLIITALYAIAGTDLRGRTKVKFTQLNGCGLMRCRPQSHKFSQKTSNWQMSSRPLSHAAGKLPLSRDDQAVYFPIADISISAEFEDLVAGDAIAIDTKTHSL